MARTGFCDAKPLLDLHKKADERRAPLRMWANGRWPQDYWQPVEVNKPSMVPLEMKECRLLHQTREGILMAFDSDRICSTADGCIEAPVLLPLLGLQVLPSLQAMVPDLLRNEVEKALEKLDHTFDRTYAWDMFVDMMSVQTKYCFPSTDLSQDFTDVTRGILVEWVIQVHEMLQFHTETLYLAIHLLNRCLRQMKMPTANLQLLACVCLLVAAKMEESCLPEVSGLCFLMDHSYTKHKLLRMERKVLSQLKFNLSYCSPVHFLKILVAVAHSSNRVEWMACYLLELSLLEAQCVLFLPVQLAGAALCLAHKVLQEPLTQEGHSAWYLASSVHAGSEPTLLRIMHIMATAAANADTGETCATFVKFSSPEAMRVSKHPGLKNAARWAQAFDRFQLQAI